MTGNRTRRESTPHTRLTRIGNRLIDLWEQDTEHRRHDRVIIMMLNGPDGGIAMGGYAENADVDGTAMADLLTHVKAVFEANGKHVDLAFFDESGNVEML